MSNVMRFLETIGGEARWGDITKDAMELALGNASIEGPLRSAILNNDAAQLLALLQGKTPVGYVMPGEEEEEEEEEDDEPGERDTRQPSSSSTTSAQ
ncbi:hypothetical protein [Dyella choica]|uniref:Uncharacterized protein n=1 Tax=Dyella choica TaxID=1927959 RepID=A0A432M1R5_9GAMM|nr:hypothetical protein [Dyella choica]RUL71083.1 hypothetical protein EKH80_19250 [Dyella choica]